MLTRRLACRSAALLLACGLCLPTSRANARAAEKTETWIEVRSPHFTVISNGGEKPARQVADQFEQIRAVFQKALPKVRVDPGQAILILAAKNENTLKSLLPQYWERKGHMHPAGVFVPGQEKHYVALRLDATGEKPYHVIYHEYVHMLINLNFQGLPVWLNEGFAEFYGNTTIGSKELLMGQPDASHVYLLRSNKLLPIDVLLNVDRNSPHYNEAEKTSVFYAQSWALLHYLILDPQMKKSQALSNFFHLLGTAKDDVESARRAFGDLKQLEKKLEGYVRQSSFYQYKMKPPAEITEKDMPARLLPAAESAALRADFHLHTGRMAEARALLEEALKLDPDLALAHESKGFLHYRLGEREEAAQEFARAVQLDSRSTMAHYFHAMLMVASAAEPGRFAEAEVSLRRATELNPNFSPAYATLAGLYTLREDALEKALAAARKAVELEPGEVQYQLALGRVLLRMNRSDEARGLAQRALAAASSPEKRSAVEFFLAEITRYQQFLAERKQYEEQARASRETLQTYLRTDSEAKPPAGGQTPAESTTPRSAGASSQRKYSAFGKITEVSCAQPPAMGLTLSLSGLVLQLHAANSFKVEYLTTAWKPPANFNPCIHLKNLSAQISYTLLEGPAYDGEIISIEVRR